MNSTLNHLPKSTAQLPDIAQLESPSPRELPARPPLSGGAKGASNARGAEAAGRVLTRIAAAVRAAVKR